MDQLNVYVYVNLITIIKDRHRITLCTHPGTTYIQHACRMNGMYGGGGGHHIIRRRLWNSFFSLYLYGKMNMRYVYMAQHTLSISVAICTCIVPFFYRAKMTTTESESKIFSERMKCYVTRYKKPNRIFQNMTAYFVDFSSVYC